jgi:hypothetical protein
MIVQSKELEEKINISVCSLKYLFFKLYLEN